MIATVASSYQANFWAFEAFLFDKEKCLQKSGYGEKPSVRPNVRPTRSKLPDRLVSILFSPNSHLIVILFHLLVSSISFINRSPHSRASSISSASFIDQFHYSQANPPIVQFKLWIVFSAMVTMQLFVIALFIGTANAPIEFLQKSKNTLLESLFSTDLKF